MDIEHEDPETCSSNACLGNGSRDIMEFQVEKDLQVSLMYLIDNSRPGNSIQFEAYLKNLDDIPEPVDQLKGIIIFGNIKGSINFFCFLSALQALLISQEVL
jgi:hypothetical protein